jgi:hypothetical protein
MGNNSGVSNLPFALSATASLTLLGIPGLQTSGITGNLTLSKTGTTARTQTARDASGNLCLDSVDNGFLVTQRFNAAQAIACGVAATAGNGLIQRVGGVTKATGDAWGTDCFLHRASAGVLLFNTTQAQADNGFIAGRSSVTSAGYDSFQNSSTWALRSQRTDGSLQWSLNTDGFGSAYLTGLANGLGVNVTPTAGNGLIQLANGTTRGNGVAHGDTYQFRASSGSIFQSGPAATDIIYSVFRNTGETAYLWAGNGTCYFGSSSATPVSIRTGNVTAITIDTSQGVTTAAANYVKVRSVAASAGTTTLNGTDDTAILTGAAIHTFTLPAAANGRRLFIKNRSSLALTVNRAGADTIDGLTTIAVATGTAKILIANGTDWCVWNA